MGWNYRILAYQFESTIEFQIHEVYYNKDGIPDRYTLNPIPVRGNTVESLSWVLDRMIECKSKPVLWAGEKFPNEYTE